MKHLEQVPRGDEAIRRAMEAAREEGPRAIARLALLCLWQVGQQSDPHTIYAGEGGSRPLTHLRWMLGRNAEIDAASVPHTLLSSFAYEYRPRFDLTQPRLKAGEASQKASEIIREASRPEHLVRRRS